MAAVLRYCGITVNKASREIGNCLLASNAKTLALAKRFNAVLRIPQYRRWAPNTESPTALER